MPVGIFRFDQSDFLYTQPAFYLLFALNGRKGIRVFFIIDKLVNIVLAGESGNLFFFVFGNPAKQVVCHAGVKCPGFVGHDVDIECTG